MDQGLGSHKRLNFLPYRAACYQARWLCAMGHRPNCKLEVYCYTTSIVQSKLDHPKGSIIYANISIIQALYAIHVLINNKEITYEMHKILTIHAK